jgi:hypothetical protein
VLGMILCNLTPIYAAIEEYILYKADYNIVVNDSNYENTEYPILNYKGTTYVPLKVMSDILGIPTTWNTELKQVEITTNTIRKEDNVLSENISNNTYEENDLIIVELNNIKYVDGKSFLNKYNSIGYYLTIEPPLNYNLKKDNKIILADIQRYNAFNVSGLKGNYIKYDDYIDKILPLIK